MTNNAYFIYHLTINQNVPMPNGGNDCYYGFVINAMNIESARKIAQINGGNEVEICTIGDDCPNIIDRNIRTWFPFWTNSNKTSCVKIGKSFLKDECIIESSYESG